MHKSLIALTSRLSYGKIGKAAKDEAEVGVVETLARVYERARNALEYRADNLVRRAAIERILKRQIILSKDPNIVSDKLLKELRWAKYLSVNEARLAKRSELEKIISKYIGFLHGTVPQDWVIKIASAEIEETFNLNTDYKQFTFFAFQVIRQKIKMRDENLDLLIYFATDKIYAESDDEKTAYHILNLAGEEITKEKFEEAWKLFNIAKNSEKLPKITKFVRRQMPPLVLLRDIYFSDPSIFKGLLTDTDKFREKAEEVLESQIEKMSERISTAGIRSVLYVFLTKMVFAFGMEVPLEILFYGHVSRLPLILNLLFPPFLMWMTTIQIKVPSKNQRAALVERTLYIIQNFDALKDEEDALKDVKDIAPPGGVIYSIFSALYGMIFVGVFGSIIIILDKIGYTVFSEFIFLFFLTIIAFFAYRIAQIAKVYSWKEIGSERSTFVDIIALPILTIGSRLSRGLSKLNFLAFTFDFILEAPFKLILGFVDDWVEFLSLKKDEQIIE